MPISLQATVRVRMTAAQGVLALQLDGVCDYDYLVGGTDIFQLVLQTSLNGRG